MPLQDFDGETWVAYSDLCGTKAMYTERPDKARQALDCFYRTVYNLHRGTRGLSCLAVSDCAVFWVHGDGDMVIPANSLDGLLDVLKRLHMQMAEAGYLVSTSVAWGTFTYQQRIELPHLQKGMFVGDAYLKAFGCNDKLVPGAIGIASCPGNRWDASLCPRMAHFLIHGPSGFKKAFIWWVDAPARLREAKRRQEQANESRFQALLAEYTQTRPGPFFDDRGSNR